MQLSEGGCRVVHPLKATVVCVVREHVSVQACECERFNVCKYHRRLKYLTSHA